MAQNVIWLLPGLFGNHLYTSRPRGLTGQTHIWLNVGALALSLLDVLRYPDDGSIYSQGLLFNITPMDAHLYRNKPEGWELRTRVYDWRNNVQSLADRFADQIELAADEGATGHYIVAYSLGGLVARGAWRVLGERGSQGLIKRIVTLGTPHRGSYAIPMVWAERNSLMNLAAGVLAARLAALKVMGPVGSAAAAFLGELDKAHTHQIVASWPSIYCTLPLADAAGVEADPELPRCYDAATWGTSLAEPPQNLLTFARDDFWPWMNHASAWPPASVLRCVAAREVTTAHKLLPPGQGVRRSIAGAPGIGFGLILRANRLANLPGFDTTTEGDGTVPLSSSRPEGFGVLTVNGEHSALPSHPEVLERIIPLLVDDAAPAPPPGEVLGGARHFALAPPQFPGPTVAYRPCCGNREACPR